MLFLLHPLKQCFWILSCPQNMFPPVMSRLRLFLLVMSSLRMFLLVMSTEALPKQAASPVMATEADAEAFILPVLATEASFKQPVYPVESMDAITASHVKSKKFPASHVKSTDVPVNQVSCWAFSVLSVSPLWSRRPSQSFRLFLLCTQRLCMSDLLLTSWSGRPFQCHLRAPRSDSNSHGGCS